MAYRGILCFSTVTWFFFTGAIFSGMPIETIVCEYLMAMFTLYQIAFAPTRKPHRIGLLFTHKKGDFCAISVTERSCAAPISKVERHISDRFCASFWCSVNRYSNRSGSE